MVMLLLYIWNYGKWNTLFGVRAVPRMLTFPLIAFRIIITLINKPWVQKTTFFFRLRKRVVSSWSHRSRIVLRIPANKKMLNWAAQIICTAHKWSLVRISKQILKFYIAVVTLSCYFIPLWEGKKYENWSLKQRSNMKVYSNFDQQIEKKCILQLLLLFINKCP